MDPRKLVEDEKPVRNTDEVLDTMLAYYDESKTIRNTLEYRWTKNQKLLKGIPLYKEKDTSTVRKRPKIRFRKIWSNAVRLLASLYQAFLLDKNKFKIQGFDQLMDWMKARVLQVMTEYRLNWLYRRRDGFVKFIWSFLDCICPGTSVVKVHWKFNEDMDIDEPCITPYPLEQVCLDWAQATVSDMRYICLENYLTKDQMKEMDYNNIEDTIAVEIPQSSLRDTRFYEVGDPARKISGTGGNYADGTIGDNYPSPGSTGEAVKDYVQLRYRVVECFYKKEGKIYFCVFNPDGFVWLQKPIVSPYGKIYPIAVGSVLLEAHKLIPESIVEPLEGPQEDLNMTMNLRKENQLLAMMGGWSIDKFGGVDRQALTNLRPGFVVTRNSGQGLVEPLRLPDVTQTSYVEANADQIMIDEMMGITQIKQGQTTTSKTGVAAINLQESNAKESLFVSIVGETLFRQVIYLLAYQIQLFETDERIFRVANSRLNQELTIQGIDVSQRDNIYDLEFDMDVEVNVGLNEASRAVQLQRLFAFIDRALQSNNATTLMMRSGVQVQNPTMIDTSKALQDIAEQLQIDDFQKYVIPVAPPSIPQQQGGGVVAQGVEGAMALQQGQQPSLPEGFAEYLQQQGR